MTELELQKGAVVHKAEMLEMDYLRNLGIEPNFADVSKHIDKLLTPALELADNESAISELKADNEELSYNCEALEDKLDSIENYVARMRKQLKGMDFGGKGEIEAILSNIEAEL